jgi:hypothetical protein
MRNIAAEDRYEWLSQPDGLEWHEKGTRIRILNPQ